jgi:hypothetical protein
VEGIFLIEKKVDLVLMMFWMLVIDERKGVLQLFLELGDGF